MKMEDTFEALAFKSCATQLHIKVCEEREKRRSPDNCDVHHINGDHSDNNPENLIIVTEEMHRWLHTGARKTNPWMSEINWFDFKREFLN